VRILGVTWSVVAYLRDKIITGELAAGKKLNEIELSSQIGISRAPLREAFRILEEGHLVVSVPRRGTYVSDVSLEDCRELYQARQMVECYSIDLIEEKKIAAFEEVEQALHECSEATLPPKGDRQKMLAYLRIFAGFHEKLIETAGNRQLISFYRKISLNLSRYQFMYAYIPGLTRDSQAEHSEVLALIKGGEYEMAKQLLRDHIKYFVELMEEQILSSTREESILRVQETLTAESERRLQVL